MKLLSYSKNGKVTKVRKVKRVKPCRVIWGAIEVPRDPEAVFKPYPEEGKEWRMRRYRNTSGEGPFRGKRIVAAPQAFSEAKVTVRLVKAAPKFKAKGKKQVLHIIRQKGGKSVRLKWNTPRKHKAYDPRPKKVLKFNTPKRPWTNAVD